MQRILATTLVAFGVSADGKPYLSVLSKDQRETFDIQIDERDVALLAERATAFLADRVRRR